MNIIGNCCIGSFLSRIYGIGNVNPFTWTTLDFESFYYLINNYENINWYNYDLIRNKHPKYDTYVYDVSVDNKINIRYFHYLFDPNYSTPKINGAEVKYNKIWEYIIEKYKEHLEKMLSLKDEPIFVCEWEHLDYNEENFYKLYNTDLKYKCVVITNNVKLKDYKKDNLLIIFDSHLKGNPPTGCMPKFFADKYAKQIKNFL